MTLIPPVSLPVPVDPVPINDLKPDILFRFMNVRGPQKETSGQAQRYFVNNVYDSLSSGDLTTVQADIETLYPQLLTRIGSGTELADQQGDVTVYKATDQYIDSPDLYASRYPELTAFIDWLDAHSANTSSSAVSSQFQTNFGTALSTYIADIAFKELQCVFWDNLFANLYAPDNAMLVTLACKYLGALHLCEIVAADPGGGIHGGVGPNDYSLAYVYRAKTLVPKWIYELFIASASDADDGVGDVTPGGGADDTVQTRFTHLTLAIKEIRNLIVKRTEAVNRELKGLQKDFEADIRGISVQDRTANIDLYNNFYDAVIALDDPYEIDSAGSYGFSTSTTSLFTEFFPSWTKLDLNNLLNLFLAEVNETAIKLGSGEREYCVRIGDAIITKKELCADMTNNDPCAVLERKNFLSKGSFTNSALIGDLLFTEQQLIKYDAGEVAHVEAVMQGLDKERTHRRLDRTETTTTTLHESMNETERETQTTERYSMEKETNNVVNQQFQIDAGVNVSAKYGVVNMTSSLDASYGNSQLQSQQTATNFSRDVTNRALTRVKELVRETQTITVINEIEETSVNKLTNNTNDHINGVYRWLDKFYLNKVINYGRRLMFEFTVPEPANFYIFRKMNKPQNGATVEKPTAPSQVTGPDGFNLNNPNVLSDTNYSFWLAQYDVPNAEQPPQEYIQYSRSFKNAYPTAGSDTFDSFSTEIEVPENYEATLVNVYAKGDSWGSSSSTPPPYFEGMLVTTGFGLGFTPINLNNIRTTIGLSTQSYLMNFEVNLMIKAKRSPESYDAWKLATYTKILDAYNQKKKAYDDWVNAQYADSTFGFTANSNNPEINRDIEKEELKKRVIELFTGQRYESFDAATNGILNVSGYPEILFKEAITEGNVVKFFEQAFEWEHMTYIFYPYFWGRKTNWMTLKNVEDVGDPLFTKFLQAGYARVVVPARPDFENYLLMFNMLSNFVSAFGCSWNFTPSIFGALGISNEFSPGVNDPVYMSVTQELINAQGLNEDNGTVIGAHVQKVPTNLVYVIPNNLATGAPLPGLPDNSTDSEISPYI